MVQNVKTKEEKQVDTCFFFQTNKYSIYAWK